MQERGDSCKSPSFPCPRNSSTSQRCFSARRRGRRRVYPGRWWWRWCGHWQWRGGRQRRRQILRDT
jgi:hypothetical protein